jgi:hypothetical protein
VDIRDLLQVDVKSTRLNPYAKDVNYHPSGVLSMTLEIYDDFETHEFSFGFTPGGKLKLFLDQIYGGNNEEND